MRTSSPSPGIKKSIISARGSGLKEQLPPAATMGYASPRSLLLSGIPARSSIFRIFVKDSSYCSVNPRMSISLAGCFFSMEKSGRSFSRISRSISAAGAKKRWQKIFSRSFST